jgi:hypothetical protein
MAIPDRKRLAELFADMQRIEEHRTLTSEKQIRKLYKEMLTDLQGFLGVEYAKYSEDDALTYTTLARKGEHARFLEEVQARVNGIMPKVNKTINDVVEKMYKTAYDGMVNAVSKAVNDKELTKLLKGIVLTPAQVIKAAVNNPVSKLTLSKTLEKNRKQIVYNIKQTVTVGIMNGDRMSTMARKIQNDVDQNYRKAMLIARTEVHRVRETGHNDASGSIDRTLSEAGSEYRMVKIWKSMRDEKVRKTSKADHRKMEGQVVLQDEDFDLGRGVTAPCPSQSGTAYNDCNCRCYVSHDLMNDEEFFQATGRHFKKVEKPKPTPENQSANTSPEPVERQQEQTAVEKEKPKLSTDTFPDSFNKGTAKKQTQKFVDYINNIDDADSDMLEIYNNIGKMESIENNGIPFKVSYGKSGHAVSYSHRYDGTLVGARLKIPKLDGDNITGGVQTTAHEFGHYIDMLMRKEADKYGNWISTSGKMKTAIESGRAGISDKVNSLFKSTNEKIKEIRTSVTSRYKAKIEKFKSDNAAVIDNWFRDHTAYKKYEKGLKSLYSECEDVIDYETRNEMNGINALQDIYDALSAGRYRDKGIVKYGHGSKYYRSEESQIHEIWANYCSLELTRPDLIKLLKEDKPELVTALDEIKAEILKKVGEM